MEAKLRESEERCRLALDAAAALVYEVGPDGSILAHGLERVTGFRPEDVELTTDWWSSLIHPDDLAAHREAVAQHRATGLPFRAVYRIRRKDGEWIWVEATAQVHKNESGAMTKMVGALVDITERKRAVDALGRSEQRFRTLYALSGRLLAARALNEALEDLLDCAISACGANFGNVQLFNPQLQALEIVVQRGFKQPFLDHFREVRVDEGSVCARGLQRAEQIMIEDVELDADFASHRAVAAEAGYRAVLSTPLKTYDGTVLGMLSTHFREPHRVPTQVRQLIEVFASHAGDVVSRLRFEQALRDAERCKDEFLTMLAHELRNPLMPLKSALELMKLGNPELIEQARATMERQVVQMNRLVDDLLDVGRIASGKLELRFETVDLASVVHHAAEVCQPSIERRSQSLSLELGTQPLHLRADPARLAQIFCNLMTNASKYTGEGGRIRVVAQRDRDCTTVSFCDTGYGISPELLPRVFDLFMQVDERPHRSGGGLGIGLALVRRLVEMHGGTVSAHSDGIGRGSKFEVRLPNTAEPGRQEQPQQRVHAVL